MATTRSEGSGVQVALRREVVEDDLGFVPRDRLKAAVRKLERNPEVGKPLGGRLKGCRSVHVDGSENRIVYRMEGTLCVVLAIGRRKDDQVYDTAEKRIS